MEAPESTALAYDEARTLRSTGEARLAYLQNKAQHDGYLDDDDDAELARLERRLARLQPHLAQLEATLAQEADNRAVAAVCDAWGGLLGHKRAAFAQLFETLEAVAPAFQALADAHQAQEALVQSLPRALQTAYRFPDTSTLAQWVASRLPRGVDWLSLLRVPPGIDRQGVQDIDPGTKPLPVLIARYQKEHRNE